MAELPFLDLASPAFSTRGPDVIRARAAHWCARTPYGLAILRHRESGLLLRDRRLRQGSHAWPARHGLSGSFTDFWQRSVIARQGEDHKRLRALAMPALAADDITALAPAFRALAAPLTERLIAADGADFLATFSAPFAGQAICLLLAMDPADWAVIAHDAADLGLAMGIDCARHAARINAACDRLMALADRLIARARRGEDTTGYVARLTRQFKAMGTLPEQALRDMVVISIFGGVDTTRAQLALAVALFLDHPDQWDALRADPALIPQAIDEVIRTRPTTTWATREATEDFEMQGQPIHAGDTVHLLVHAAGRDPAIGADDRFDITVRRKMHFGFGGGAHHCLGQLVARTDMAAALAALAARVRRFEAAGPADWLPDSGNTSPRALPVRAIAV